MTDPIDAVRWLFDSECFTHCTPQEALVLIYLAVTREPGRPLYDLSRILDPGVHRKIGIKNPIQNGRYLMFFKKTKLDPERILVEAFYHKNALPKNGK